MPFTTVDTRGMSCPLPILKVRKAMRSVAPGGEVLVLATDPGAQDDLRAFCVISGCKFLSAKTDPDGSFRFLIAQGDKQQGR